MVVAYPKEPGVVWRYKQTYLAHFNCFRYKGVVFRTFFEPYMIPRYKRLYARLKRWWIEK